MKRIPLRNRKGKIVKWAIVDDDDYERVRKIRWAYYGSRGKNYAYSQKTRRISLHRLILNAPKGTMVDHKNRNGLDNRKENLRFCTPAQNAQNRSKNKSYTTSGYKGVKRVERANNSVKWEVSIKINYKRIYLGTFKTRKEAAKKYDEAALRFHGEFACLNL